MQAYQKEFIEFCLSHGALCFGQFTLKSGRRSPYFFNTGAFHTGAALARLGAYYARAVAASGLAFDMLFGPAYKGIPLAAATAIALAVHEGRDVPYCFNRKEPKDHGEGGATVGAPLRGRVLIIDDVLTTGSAAAESVALIRAAAATPCGLVIALDRQERAEGGLSAVEEVRQRHAIPVLSIIDLDTLVAYLGEKADMQEQLARMRSYRASYGASG